MSQIQEEKPSGKWSLKNNLIMLQNGTSDARGYNQWKQAGRQVRKGSKAFYIFGPTIPAKDDPNQSIRFHKIPVFRIEDTDPINRGSSN